MLLHRCHVRVEVRDVMRQPLVHTPNSIDKFLSESPLMIFKDLDDLGVHVIKVPLYRLDVVLQGGLVRDTLGSHGLVDGVVILLQGVLECRKDCTEVRDRDLSDFNGVEHIARMRLPGLILSGYPLLWR